MSVRLEAELATRQPWAFAPPMAASDELTEEQIEDLRDAYNTQAGEGNQLPTKELGKVRRRSCVQPAIRQHRTKT